MLLACGEEESHEGPFHGLFPSPPAPVLLGSRARAHRLRHGFSSLLPGWDVSAELPRAPGLLSALGEWYVTPICLFVFVLLTHSCSLIHLTFTTHSTESLRGAKGLHRYINIILL